MRRSILAAVFALLALPLGSFPSSAHPLGNFTVNHLSRITVTSDAVRVRYVLDLAEIPTLQESQAGRIDGIATRLASELALRMDGVSVPLRLVASSVTELPGQAGLTTLRVTLDLDGPAASDGARIQYHDSTYAGRIGWHDVLIDGNVRDASASAEDRTNELRSYPSDPTLTPPDVTDAAATVDLSAVATRGGAASLASVPRFSVDAGANALTEFLRSGDADLGALAAALAVAMMLGAIHAFGPGHGKAMVAAYLVGSRGTPSQAIFLGLTVTVTHTVGVYALGAITLVAAQYVLPERLYPILGTLSGLLVMAIGVGLLRARVSTFLAAKRDDGSAHHDHHAHGDGPGQHRHGEAVGLRGLLALGVSGGLLPCPTALVVLLAAVSLHNVALGMILVAAFSVGLAAVLTGIGLAFVIGQRAIGRHGMLSRLTGSVAARALPLVSAVAVTVAGIVIAIGAARGFA